jgi:hypothetical protein
MFEKNTENSYEVDFEPAPKHWPRYRSRALPRSPRRLQTLIRPRLRHCLVDSIPAKATMMIKFMRGQTGVRLGQGVSERLDRARRGEAQVTVSCEATRHGCIRSRRNVLLAGSRTRCGGSVRGGREAVCVGRGGGGQTGGLGTGERGSSICRGSSALPRRIRWPAGRSTCCGWRVVIQKRCHASRKSCRRGQGSEIRPVITRLFEGCVWSGLCDRLWRCMERVFFLLLLLLLLRLLLR